jgi:hypothetical protein
MQKNIGAVAPFFSGLEESFHRCAIVGALHGHSVFGASAM